jgi:hypothetical protein
MKSPQNDGRARGLRLSAASGKRCASGLSERDIKAVGGLVFVGTARLSVLSAALSYMSAIVFNHRWAPHYLFQGQSKELVTLTCIITRPPMCIAALPDQKDLSF